MLAEPTPQCGYEAMTSLLGSGQPIPTALISSADAISLGILDAARDHWVSVPQQISLLSYGGIEQAAHSIPPLTTVSGDIEAMGADAVHLLVEMIEGRMPTKSRHVYPVRLILRETTSAPPAR
jgi:LacI family transcriptional regulator